MVWWNWKYSLVRRGKRNWLIKEGKNIRGYPAGEERVLTINLELDKIRYSKNTEYKFSISYRSGDSEVGRLNCSVCSGFLKCGKKERVLR